MRAGAAKLGVLTIGQSPRVDVLPEFLPMLGPGVEIAQRGALDGLSRAEIESLAPSERDYALVTRLRDGSEVKLAERLIMERMRRCARELEDEGAEIIALFCTGEFPDLGTGIPVLRPDLIMARLVAALIPGGRLCAIVPLPEQIPAMTDKWSRSGCSVVAESVSPYLATDREVELAADRVAKLNCDLAVLDCIGYSERARSIFRDRLNRPVILPRTLLGRIAAEMLTS
jgi:protein AroM